MSSESVIDRSVLLVLSAPSGTGKTTIARRLVSELPDASFSISCTTRKPRGKERDGVDYFFVSETTFREMLHDDRFVEWAEVHGNFYGTPRDQVESAQKEGRVLVFDIDVQGGEQIKKRYSEAATILILPPSATELERRLRGRNTNEALDIERRLLAAQSEIRRARSYDYSVLNDELDRAVEDVKAIVRAERARSRRIDIAQLGF